MASNETNRGNDRGNRVPHRTIRPASHRSEHPNEKQSTRQLSDLRRHLDHMERMAVLMWEMSVTWAPQKNVFIITFQRMNGISGKIYTLEFAPQEMNALMTQGKNIYDHVFPERPMPSGSAIN